MKNIIKEDQNFEKKIISFQNNHFYFQILLQKSLKIHSKKSDQNQQQDFNLQIHLKNLLNSDKIHDYNLKIYQKPQKNSYSYTKIFKFLKKLKSDTKSYNIHVNQDKKQVEVYQKPKLLGGGNTLCCGDTRLKDNEIDLQSRQVEVSQSQNVIPVIYDDFEDDFDDDIDFQVFQSNIQNIQQQKKETQYKEENTFIPVQDNDQDILGCVSNGSCKIYFVVNYMQQDRPLYARKQFNHEEQFKTEVKAYDQLIEQFSQNQDLLSKLKDQATLMEKRDQSKLMIEFKLGFCTLENFMCQRAEKQLKWQKEEVLFVIYKLFKFVDFMAENKWYHGDIKPSNIIIVKDPKVSEEELYSIKIIDFGGAQNDFREQHSRTPAYFQSHKRYEAIEKKKSLKLNGFSSEQERLGAECFTILRTLQYMFVLSQSSEKRKIELQKLFDINIQAFEQSLSYSQFISQCNKVRPIVSMYQSKKKVLDLFKEMRNEWFKNDKQFQQFLNFMESYVLEEKFANLQELRDKLINNEEFFPEKVRNFGIINNHNIVKQSIKQILKKQSGFQRYDNCPLELLFLMDSYIKDRQCTTTPNKIFIDYIKQLNQQENKNDTWKIDQKLMTLQNFKQGDQSNQKGDILQEQVDEFIGNESLELLLIHGGIGIGKTSFLKDLKIRRQIQNQPVLYFNMQSSANFISDQYSYELFCDVLEKKVQEILKECHSMIKTNIVIMFDGCDNLQQAMLSSTTFVDMVQPIRDLQKYFPKNVNLKVIATSQHQNFRNFVNYLEGGFFSDNPKIDNKFESSFKMIQVLPLNDKQINSYIENYVCQVRKRKDYWLDDLIFYETKEEYFRDFQKQKDLWKMGQNPLFLRIILQVLPYLNKQEEKENNIMYNNKLLNNKYFHYNFQREFVKLYFRKKVQKLSYQEVSYLLGCESIDVNTEEKYIREAVNHLFSFNKIIAVKHYQDLMAPVDILNSQSLEKKFAEINILHQEQIEMLIKCSPIIAVEQHNTQASKQASQDEDFKILNQEPRKQIKYVFEHSFMKQLFIVDSFLQEMNKLRNIDLTSMDLKKLDSLNPLVSVHDLMAHSILAKKKLRFEEDKNLIWLVQDFAKNRIYIDQCQNMVDLAKVMGKLCKTQIEKKQQQQKAKQQNQDNITSKKHDFTAINTLQNNIQVMLTSSLDDSTIGNLGNKNNLNSEKNLNDKQPNQQQQQQQQKESKHGKSKSFGFNSLEKFGIGSKLKEVGNKYNSIKNAASSTSEFVSALSSLRGNKNSNNWYNESMYAEE